MKRLVLMAALITLSARLSAQSNQVPNSSFENPVACPSSAQFSNLMIVCVPNWISPNEGSPDYYNTCATNVYFNTLNNVYGGQLARSGEGYVGAYFFSLNQPEGREYIQVQLTQPIHAGIRYQVGFHVSLAELSLYAISSLGAHLSTEPLDQNDYWVIDVEPHIQNPSGNIIADTSGWVLITDTFTGRHGGGEQWLTIGNFNYAAQSDTFAFQPPNPDMGNFFFSYYYIDDVSVVALDSVPDDIAEHTALEINVWPNPATDVLHIQGQKPIESMQLYDLRGRAVLRQKVVSNRFSLNLNGMPPGIYLLEVSDKYGRRSVQKVVVQ